MCPRAVDDDCADVVAVVRPGLRIDDDFVDVLTTAGRAGAVDDDCAGGSARRSRQLRRS